MLHKHTDKPHQQPLLHALLLWYLLTQPLLHQMVAPAQHHLPCYHLLIWGPHTCKDPQRFCIAFINPFFLLLPALPTATPQALSLQPSQGEHSPCSSREYSSATPDELQIADSDKLTVLKHLPQPRVSSLPGQTASL